MSTLLPLDQHWVCQASPNMNPGTRAGRQQVVSISPLRAARVLGGISVPSFVLVTLDLLYVTAVYGASILDVHRMFLYLDLNRQKNTSFSIKPSWSNGYLYDLSHGRSGFDTPTLHFHFVIFFNWGWLISLCCQDQETRVHKFSLFNISGLHIGECWIFRNA